MPSVHAWSVTLREQIEVQHTCGDVEKAFRQVEAGRIHAVAST